VTAGPARVRLAAALAAENDRLLACVHCGFCLPACPTYTRLGDENDSPRGRLYLMRAVVEGRLDAASDAYGLHIDRCLGCRACEPVCPAGVQYGFLLERARAVQIEAAGHRAVSRALLAVYARDALRKVFDAGGRLLRAVGLSRLLLRVLPRRFDRIRFGLAMLEATRPWSRLEETEFRDAPPRATPRRRVAMLEGCVQRGLFGRVNRATRRVLEMNGLHVIDSPGQACCGALHAHGGELERARDLARSNIAAFDAAGVELVVVNAAGCGALMKEYGELLHDDPVWAERARLFAGRVRDVAELLVEIGPAPGAPLPLRVAYDAPCHLHHAQRITRAPMDMLRAVPQLEVVPVAGYEECCGGAGIYGLLHPDLGGRILDDKVAAVRAAAPDVIATPNPGCMMQIGAGLRLAGSELPVVHPIELLDASYARLAGAAQTEDAVRARALLTEEGP
jgi:glycolate oxidase iron-sulfur subunit